MLDDEALESIETLVGKRLWISNQQFPSAQMLFTDEQLVDLFLKTTSHWYNDPNQVLYRWEEEARADLLLWLKSYTDKNWDNWPDDLPYQLEYCRTKFWDDWVGIDGIFTQYFWEHKLQLITRVRCRLTDAMKTGDTNAKSAIRVLLGKLQTNNQENDEAVISSVKMLIKQNEEEIETRSGRVKMPDGTVQEVTVTNQEQDIKRLQLEIEVLKEFLPDFLSSDKIKEILTQNLAQINAAKNVGSAMGVAMKILKEHGAVEGTTVKEVVASIYGQ
jgi:uncharacterized protein YqeY